VLGLDTDHGDEPFELTRTFVDRVPFVWPNINMLTPYGGTPMHSAMAREGRLLPAMPLALYCSPYLAFVPRHYEPVAFYDRLIALLVHCVSMRMTARRLTARVSTALGLARLGQTVAVRRDISEMRGVRDALRSDLKLRRFHEGRGADIPPLYLAQLRKRLGPLRDLLSAEDLRPVQPAIPLLPPRTAVRPRVAESV
jgi:hypothetical protein